MVDQSSTGPSIRPDFSQLSIAKDAWSAPFWTAVADHHRIDMPRCGACGTFRWPPGPFCPKCRSQAVEWVSAGQGRIYSFTILPVMGGAPDTPLRVRIPVLVVFDNAPGVRLPSVLVDADPATVAIDDPVTPDWLEAADGVVAVFRKSTA